MTRRGVLMARRGVLMARRDTEDLEEWPGLEERLLLRDASSLRRDGGMGDAEAEYVSSAYRGAIPCLIKVDRMVIPHGTSHSLFDKRRATRLIVVGV